MLAWDHTRSVEMPRAVDEIYASNVLPDQIKHWLADRCNVHFNKDEQVAAFETERLLRRQHRRQEGSPPRPHESRFNRRQQGGGAVGGPSRRAIAGPSRRYGRNSPSDSSDSSVNQITPSS
ncbi:hypothetical protein HN51_015252 [Arachis hypogaea]